MAGARIAHGLGLAVLHLAGAFPSYRLQIPNGLQVPCPPGVGGCDPGNAIDCQPTSVCNGVGHRNCQGGQLPLNAFGRDFYAAGSEWTQELCNMDSDGDGLTNGQELGDPCCLWESVDVPSDYMNSFRPTHPGFANSKDEVAAYTKPSCNSTTPAKKGAKRNLYNPGEVQKWTDLRIKSYPVPAAKTTYVNIGVNFPDASADKFHVVYAIALVDQSKYLHHYVIKGCPFQFPAELDGKPINSTLANKCDKPFGGWTPGAHVVETVPWAGQPIGAGFGVVALNIQVHYNNQDQDTGKVDSSGLRIWYTPTLRNMSLGGVAVTQLSVNPHIVVPPQVPRWFITRTCKLTVVDIVTGQPAGLNVLGVSYHAHLLAREMYAELRPAGEERWTDFGSAPIWSFDDQGMRDILNWGVVLKTNDTIQTTCVMDSTSRSDGTKFGIETTDEMCWAGFHGWPRSVFAYCRGDIWTGELEANESGLGLARRHPVDQAADVWDGTNMLTGGAAVRSGGAQGRCQNGLTDQKCAGVAILAGKQGLSCDDDLASIDVRLAGGSLVTTCCATACNGTCKGRPECTAGGSVHAGTRSAGDALPTLLRCTPPAAPAGPKKEDVSRGSQPASLAASALVAAGGLLLAAARA